MRYAILTDIHANLEALEAVLAKIDEFAEQEPLDQIWFLGDLVGYGPNPNECIIKLRERTDVIIAGNHDWAAVGKIDLEDFSEAARLSAQWTAEQLTEEHRKFLSDLPERIEIGDCVIVHGSPYGPLWEYLTTEVLAERSFQYFNSRYCFIGHTHVPVIFQQPDTIANTPTIPLETSESNAISLSEQSMQQDNASNKVNADDDTETITSKQTIKADSEETDSAQELLVKADSPGEDAHLDSVENIEDHTPIIPLEDAEKTEAIYQEDTEEEDVPSSSVIPQDLTLDSTRETQEDVEPSEEITSEEAILTAEDRLNQEIEELLGLLGLSQSMVNVTNEMFAAPEGEWKNLDHHRAIINPGGVGQPRDGDPRAAFMIYDTEHGFTFYRVAYPFEKTQEKIIKAGLPQYLATRLAYGR